jgi:hypothetical protein
MHACWRPGHPPSLLPTWSTQGLPLQEWDSQTVFWTMPEANQTIVWDTRQYWNCLAWLEIQDMFTFRHYAIESQLNTWGWSQWRTSCNAMECSYITGVMAMTTCWLISSVSTFPQMSPKECMKVHCWIGVPTSFKPYKFSTYGLLML